MVSIVEVTNNTTYCRKTNKLRNSMWGAARNISTKKLDINCFKTISIIINLRLDETLSFVIDCPKGGGGFSIKGICFI